ncbi:hypothetical protein Tco_0972382 [Tanacetum coccineum]
MQSNKTSACHRPEIVVCFAAHGVYLLNRRTLRRPMAEICMDREQCWMNFIIRHLKVWELGKEGIDVEDSFAPVARVGISFGFSLPQAAHKSCSDLSDGPVQASVVNDKWRLLKITLQAPFLNDKMMSVHISSGLVLHQMTSDHNRSELGIQDHNNEQSSSKLVPKVVPLAVKTATSRQELELLFHHHIAMLRTTSK